MHKIPLIDIRGSGPETLLKGLKSEARALIEASRGTFGPLVGALSHAGAPLGDGLVKHWLNRTNNPYRQEIAAFAQVLGGSGVYSLNLVYEFGCTTGVYTTPAGPRLLRVLDWPFKGLGEHLVVAHQRGAAGDFHNATWPAVSGVYTAMAHGRFAVALNQAPMRRHKGGILRDWWKNRRMVWGSNALPPEHLLRKACEEAATYEEAKQMLLTTPIALPVIYILAGTKPGEGCVIERLEERAGLLELADRPSVNAANHFMTHLNGIGYGWRPREMDSCGRAVCGGRITSAQAENADMAWFKFPLANPNSRVCFSANAATGEMSLIGTEGEKPVTELFRL